MYLCFYSEWPHHIAGNCQMKNEMEVRHRAEKVHHWIGKSSFHKNKVPGIYMYLCSVICRCIGP